LHLSIVRGTFRFMKKAVVIGILIIVAVLGISLATVKTPKSSYSNKLQVVAAENFWGSLAAQIGGSQVNVVSIVSDPNADPHEYASNSTDARAIASANLVIINGAGYDSWATKIIGASPSSSRQLLNVSSLLNQPSGVNPHFWYSPSYVNRIVDQITENYCSIDTKNCSYYQNNLSLLQSKLAAYQIQIKDIAAKYKGIKVAATEDIFVYLAQAAGLNLISPADFIQAVAEGNDPPAGSVATFETQLNSGQVKLLVYNSQTVTPLTTAIKKIAGERNIPIVGITETIQPPNVSFQDWMNEEIISIEKALNATS